MEITFNVGLSIGYTHSRKDTLTIDVDDDATPEEIEKAKEEAAQDWANNFIDLYFD